MASLPKIGAVTYQEWLKMPVVQEGREEVVNGEIRIEGILKPRRSRPPVRRW